MVIMKWLEIFIREDEMEEFNNLINLLGQESLGRTITVITALGGSVVILAKFMLKVINAQKLSDIEKVFMDRKQRTNLKLMELSIVIMVMWFVNVILMLVKDDMLSALLALSFVISSILIMVYCIYKFVHFIWCRFIKSNKSWKIDDFMDEVLFVSGFLIGTEIGKLTYYNTEGGLWKGLVVCLVSSVAITCLLVISNSFMEDGPSRVYFYGRHGKPVYIYYKLGEDLLLCGDHKNMKEAEIRLMDFSSFKKGNHKLVIEVPDNNIQSRTG